MAQTVVVQDEALKAAQARIETLERELAQARTEAADRAEYDRRGSSAPSPWGPRAREAMGRPDEDDERDGYGHRDYERQDYERRDGYDRRDDDAPRATPGARPSYGGSGLAYGAPPQSSGPQGYPQPSAPQPPQAEVSRGGGGFLSGALQTAAGVAAGALIFQGVRSLFGGEEAQAGAADQAARAAGGGAADDGAAGGSTMDQISDQFSGWFGGTDKANDDHPQPDGDDDDFDGDSGGDDRWI
ncbi:DUF2076 domain-containing protein [Chenggangzhangella methanolivorans]|uniref:DUF2076 domain-containing protein n=2 Tax=Chenggangzhangella methanolivorans TaxID=1437009 RepID=A0A9E6UKE0_9HYPH|nr:DUF2076 domain-containing protein [Chenggangzhangella methanolivorans]QZN99191.1 DUF2076 domain-containing protein [Chenggangzhangella methanolivorans]